MQVNMETSAGLWGENLYNQKYELFKMLKMFLALNPNASAFLAR